MPPATSSALLPALTLRIAKLLEDALVVGVGHTPSVRVTQPRELVHGSAEGITLTLIDVRAVTALRNVPPRAGGEASPPAAVIEAHYLLTAWANQATLQQWMLAAALRQLHHHPVISAGELKHPLTAGAPLGVDETATFRLAPTDLSLEQSAALAARLGATALPPSVVIVAGPIVLD